MPFGSAPGMSGDRRVADIQRARDHSTSSPAPQALWRRFLAIPLCSDRRLRFATAGKEAKAGANATSKPSHLRKVHSVALNESILTGVLPERLFPPKSVGAVIGHDIPYTHRGFGQVLQRYEGRLQLQRTTQHPFA